MLDFFDIKDDKPTIDEYIIEEKGVTMFDYLSDITVNKRGNVFERDPEMKQFNSFMILRFLSMDEGYLPTINSLNEFQDSLTKQELYGLLLKIIPRSRKFLKYPKQESSSISNNDIELLTQYFKCSKAEALEFLKLKLLSNSDIARIKELFGGKK
jgi:NACalpha-BTF3-like transcription factor